MRGIWRINTFLRQSLCSHLDDGALESYRDKPIETILAKDRAFACLVNPYIICKPSRWHQELPVYFLVVAQKE
jgi:hypothetical protein